jgi:membrane-associated phospholipid phosphatase
VNTNNLRGPVLVMLVSWLSCSISFSQNQPTTLPPSMPNTVSSFFYKHQAAFRMQSSPFGSPSPDSPQDSHDGVVVRSFKRFGKDQAEIYSAPFRLRNLKWDALVLAGTAGLIATDRRASRALPNSHLSLSRNLSNASLVGTSAALGGLWIYGMKTHNEHANETGELTLESLANTFTVYTLTQFLSGRERPREGTGNGRFWIHNGFDGSFPAGHPMFTWAMATVAAHEYPRPWVELLAYGAATTVSVTRYTARLHYPSDVVVGSLLGYLVGTHIFHSHCTALSDACHPHHSTLSKMLAILR